jgi:hypothetical protein
MYKLININNYLGIAGLEDAPVKNPQKKATLGLPTWGFFKTIRHLMTFYQK